LVFLGFLLEFLEFLLFFGLFLLFLLLLLVLSGFFLLLLLLLLFFVFLVDFDFVFLEFVFLHTLLLLLQHDLLFQTSIGCADAGGVGYSLQIVLQCEVEVLDVALGEAGVVLVGLGCLRTGLLQLGLVEFVQLGNNRFVGGDFCHREFALGQGSHLFYLFHLLNAFENVDVETIPQEFIKEGLDHTPGLTQDVDAWFWQFLCLYHVFFFH